MQVKFYAIMKCSAFRRLLSWHNDFLQEDGFPFVDEDSRDKKMATAVISNAWIF